MTVRNNGFTFKQFHVNHQDCAMKVGTDGILLGAWANIDEAKNILDLGTGTGLVALMLAQRSHPTCKISAVEIDEDAVKQAKENIQASPWYDKIHLYQADVIAFAQQPPHLFDCVVANPPYFDPAQDCKTIQRNMARYTLNYEHNDWLNAAAKCLVDSGKIHFILPYEAGKHLQKKTALCCIEECEVVTKMGKAPQRLLLTFSPKTQPIKHSQIIIYDENNQYHSDFVELTQAFYLKF